MLKSSQVESKLAVGWCRIHMHMHHLLHASQRTPKRGDRRAAVRRLGAHSDGCSVRSGSHTSAPAPRSAVVRHVVRPLCGSAFSCKQGSCCLLLVCAALSHNACLRWVRSHTSVSVCDRCGGAAFQLPLARLDLIEVRCGLGWSRSWTQGVLHLASCLAPAAAGAEIYCIFNKYNTALPRPHRKGHGMLLNTKQTKPRSPAPP